MTMGHFSAHRPAMGVAGAFLHKKDDPFRCFSVTSSLFIRAKIIFRKQTGYEEDFCHTDNV
jgi:hypothetical protein